MIVHYVWKTVSVTYGPFGSTATRVYEGWFLFGVLPLYIRTRAWEGL